MPKLRRITEMELGRVDSASSSEEVITKVEIETTVNRRRSQSTGKIHGDAASLQLRQAARRRMHRAVSTSLEIWNAGR